MGPGSGEPPAPHIRANALVTRFVAEHLAARTFNTFPDAPGHRDYVIAAARARGLEVVKVADGHYFYRGGNPVGGIRRMVTTLVGHQAVLICGAKHLTRGLLTAAGVPVPRGADFAPGELEQARAFVRSLGAPAVVKPSRGRGGGGVTVAVTTETGLEAAWARARATGERGDRILVEQQMEGVDVRAFVVQDAVVAAAVRVPAHVVGDGHSSLAALIEHKQREREHHAYLARMPLVVDERLLRATDRAPDSVPAEGQVVLLNGVANLHQGGESLDVTDLLAEPVKELAVRAVRAIPGLGVAGVDLMVRSLDDTAGAVVLEANTSANISVHHRPAYGRAIDVGAAIVDAMLERHTLQPDRTPPGAASARAGD